ncbi:MAG TPA: HAD-IA family hydrolase [Geobacteraceae bacterium]|nr:HAD-IA family hydrolase [Geobacteraceae bacterium]
MAYNSFMDKNRDIPDMLAGRYWVFDLDGTLTLPVHDFAMIRASLAVPDGADILDHLAALHADEARPLHARLDVIERELVNLTEAAPGARELVELLAQDGCLLGILTRNKREIALLTLEHIGLAGFFQTEGIVGRDEALPKPDPDGIHRLARHWRAPSQELVMVGDYLYDLQAGQAAGAATIHVHGTIERRWPEWTDLCVASLEDLAGQVRLARSNRADIR